MYDYPGRPQYEKWDALQAKYRKQQASQCMIFTPENCKRFRVIRYALPITDFLRESGIELERVNKFIKLENIDEDLTEMGFPPCDEVVNIWDTGNREMTDDFIQIINRLFADDFVNFGYEMLT
jgi:hypothetical protein